MNFKHPDILWALFLLVIPIIVHLFQLRKFKKTPFTNVRLLKKISTETRKSSELKRWLVLFVRMSALACIVIAFAQPYIARRDIQSKLTETIVYLDNSFSMQAKGANGPLMQRAIKELIDNISLKSSISVLTNNDSYKSLGPSYLQETLLNITYTDKQYSFDEVVLKAKGMFSNDSTSVKNLIYISDFQLRNSTETFNIDKKINVRAVKLTPESINNISIDSICFKDHASGTRMLSVRLSKEGNVNDNIPVSLLGEDNKLLAKTSVTFNSSNIAEALFNAANLEGVNGMISIADNGLLYDNQFFFSINRPEKINVLVISNTDDQFLKKIYTDDEFNYTSYPLNQLDYSRLNNNNLIVLNEVAPSQPLVNTLDNLKNSGISILVIPELSDRINTAYYKKITNVSFDSIARGSKKLTSINFDHPLLYEVFENRVSNFQYPEVNQYYRTSGDFSTILGFENNDPFLISNGTNYSFTASLNSNNSNFKNSPIIVPVLYNMGKRSLSLPTLYYTTEANEDIDLNISLDQDETVTIRNEEFNFIPIQQNYGEKVRVNTSNTVTKAGHYGVYVREQLLQHLSFNHNRKESNLQYLDINQLNNISVSESIPSLFEELKSENKVKELWKWFVIFALIFLIAETLILKYLK
ncbi:BatA domain-containing protein [Zhouia spongiae]|nr:BatA domain-containing protein [Zhouia spongiae]